MNEWIPVSARLPDDDTSVLMALSDDEVWQGYRDGDIWRDNLATPIAPERVTHWMHMPAAPGGAPA